MRGSVYYLRGGGRHPYLVSLEEGPERYVRSTTFVCSGDELQELGRRVAASGLPAMPVVSGDPGGGHGLIVELPEGELFRFLADSSEVEPIANRDLPVQLTHVVINSRDAEATATKTEQVLDFRVSDRTKGMVFVRCSRSHHSTAFARAGFSSLNHIAFEMQDLDAVMRAIGRMRDHGFEPAWGPGRHGPAVSNVFAYYITSVRRRRRILNRSRKPVAGRLSRRAARRLDLAARVVSISGACPTKMSSLSSPAERKFQFQSAHWTPAPIAGMQTGNHSMKYASFLRPDGRAAYGRIDSDRIIDLSGSDAATDLLEAIASGTLATLAAGRSYALAEIVLLPVIPKP
ncbi:MAG: VOC family protein [Vicinamibacterales bacterium]